MAEKPKPADNASDERVWPEDVELQYDQGQISALQADMKAGNTPITRQTMQGSPTAEVTQLSPGRAESGGEAQFPEPDDLTHRKAA